MSGGGGLLGFWWACGFFPDEGVNLHTNSLKRWVTLPPKEHILLLQNIGNLVPCNTILKSILLAS